MEIYLSVSEVLAQRHRLFSSTGYGAIPCVVLNGKEHLAFRISAVDRCRCCQTELKISC